jgi:hypothetical protein
MLKQIGFELVSGSQCHHGVACACMKASSNTLIIGTAHSSIGYACGLSYCALAKCKPPLGPSGALDQRFSARDSSAFFDTSDAICKMS